MSLYGTFLARVPPGSQREHDWNQAKQLPCAGLCWGEHDLHAHTSVLTSELPWDETFRILELAPDHSFVLLSTIPGEEDPALHDNWKLIAEEYPLFCYAEIGLQADLFTAAGGGILKLAAQFIRHALTTHEPMENAPERMPRESCFPRVELFLDLSVSDIVVYLFSNDMESFFDSTSNLRRQTVGDFIFWVTKTVQEASIPAWFDDIDAVSRTRHFCESTYTLLGRTIPPDLGENVSSSEIIERTCGRISEKPTSLRPLTFLSTFPGHERDTELKTALSKFAIGNERLSTTSGSFDLIFVGVGPERRRAAQKDVVQLSLKVLHLLWDSLGPLSEAPTVLRTHTHWIWPKPSEDERITPHPAHSRPFERRQRHSDGRPIVQVLDVVEQTFNAIRANHLTRGYTFVKPIEPFLRRLREIVQEAIGLHAGRPLSASVEGQSILADFDDITSRLGAMLTTHTYGTTHVLREEIALFPGASCHKLLSIYTNILHRFGQALEEIFGQSFLPPYLCTIAGVHPARTHKYFLDTASRPSLVIFDVAGTHLLQPERVLFLLAHEIMHVAPLARFQATLAEPLLREAAHCIAKTALFCELVAADRNVETLGEDIASMLIEDHRNHLENQPLELQDPWHEAKMRLSFVRHHVVYLAYLLGLDTDGQGELRLDTKQLERLDNLRRRLSAMHEMPETGLTLREIEELFDESLIDVLAAASTSFRGYATLLHTDGMLAGNHAEVDSQRKKIMMAIANRMTNQPVEDEWGTVKPWKALLDGLENNVARVVMDVFQSKNDSLKRLFERLSVPTLWSWSNDDLEVLLEFFEVAS